MTTQLTTVTLEVRGLLPLMTDNPHTMQAEPNGGSGKATTEKLPPDVTADLATYRDEDGHFCLPAFAFRGCILAAASAWKGLRARQTMKTVLGHILIEPEWVVITDPQTQEPHTEYIVDVRRAVNKNTKGAILKARPRWNQWGATVSVLYDAEIVGANAKDQIAKILDDGGSRFGVGSFRIEKSGPFGRFEVVNYG